MSSRLLACPALVGAVLGSVLATSVARADPVADAKDLFTRGRELRTQGDCANAAGMFRKAYELYPAGLGSLRNLAECEESLGHFASSRRAWVDLKRTLLTNADRKYDGWSQDADTAAARLAPKVATLTIDVNVVSPGGEAAPATGVDVSLDGEKLPASLLGTPLDRDPGKHVVRVAGERVQGEQQRTVALVAGDAKRVALRVVTVPEKGNADEAPPPPGSPPPTVLPPDDAQEHARSMKRTAAWIGIGVGGASLIGAGISLLVRQSALDDVNNGCSAHQGCDPALQSTVSRGQTASTLVTVLGVVGVVGLTSGIVLLATSSGHAQTSSLVVTPTLGGATAAWRF